MDASAAARQIHALSAVDTDIARLLGLASSSLALLTLPQTDSPSAALPPGEERSEQFVLEVSEYFERLDAIHGNIRTAIAHIRKARIAPSTINAPPLGFVPPSFGVGLPEAFSADEEPQPHPPNPSSTSHQDDRTSGSDASIAQGFQECRVERDAWKSIYEALIEKKSKMHQN